MDEAACRLNGLAQEMDETAPRVRFADLSAMLRLREEREQRARADLLEAQRARDAAAVRRRSAEETRAATVARRQTEERSMYDAFSGLLLSTVDVEAFRSHLVRLDESVTNADRHVAAETSRLQAAERTAEQRRRTFLARNAEARKWQRMRERVAVSRARKADADEEAGLEDATADLRGAMFARGSEP